MSPATCPQGHPIEIAGSRFCATCGAPLDGARLRDVPTCALHPERRAVEPCPRCGTFACQACLVQLTPDLRLCPSCRTRDQEIPLPWDRREELGLWRAYFNTTFALLFSPNRTLEGARSTGPLGSSLLFCTISQLASILTTAIFYGIFIGGLGAMLAAIDKDSDGVSSGVMVGVGLGLTAGLVLLTVVVGLGLTLLNAALDHQVLRLAGAQPRGFEVTLRASALSQATAICGLVPICGLYVYPVWAIILRVFLYRAFHRTTTGRAALGAMLAPGVVLFLGLVFYAVVMLLVGLASSK